MQSSRATTANKYRRYAGIDFLHIDQLQDSKDKSNPVKYLQKAPVSGAFFGPKEGHMGAGIDGELGALQKRKSLLQN